VWNWLAVLNRNSEDIMSWRILTYHGVPEECAAGFARQLDHWRGCGWRAVSLGEGLRRLAEPDTFFTVTFDDGQFSVCDVAQRVLDERGIKATLYLATDYVLRGCTYRDVPALRACTWAQLGRWLDAGHEVGSHTHTHISLPACSRDRLSEELECSRNVLKQELGHHPVHFAYPYGDHDPKTYEWLRSLGGWATAATTDRGWNGPGTDPLRLRRDAMEPAWSIRHGNLRLLLGAYPRVGSLIRRSRFRLRRWANLRT
jgi:peptidoglycan/xylan/chitin deacetylase (PgdA/CDA1 family)